MPLSYPEAFDSYRSSHRMCSKTKGVLNIFAKIQRTAYAQSLLFNKVGGLRPATLLKQSLWFRCFPMNFAKLLRTPILKNICERLLLVAGWRTMQKLNRRDLLFLPCLVYINISVGSSFFFFYLRFLYAYLFWFLKLNLQTENYMENFGRF